MVVLESEQTQIDVLLPDFHEGKISKPCTTCPLDRSEKVMLDDLKDRNGYGTTPNPGRSSILLEQKFWKIKRKANRGEKSLAQF